MSGFRVSLCFALLCLALAACQSGGSQKPALSASDAEALLEYVRPAQDAPILAHWGPHRVGQTGITISDSARTVWPESVAADGRLQIDARKLQARVWYPAKAPARTAQRSLYTRIFVQDPKWPMPDFPASWMTHGEALQDADPHKTMRFPVVILAHGWAGNDVSMVYLAENLASKGYVIIAPDFEDVAPGDPHVFELLFPRAVTRRALDVQSTMTAIQALASDETNILGKIADTDRIALIGNSLGGMGVLRAAGATYSATSPAASWIKASDFEKQTDKSKTPAVFSSEAIDALVLIAPWGAQDGTALFGPPGLAKIRASLLVMGGTADQIAGYETGPKRIFQQAGSSRKYLLTFENAGHSLTPGATPNSGDDYAYASVGIRDAVWRNESIAAVEQHFITAFLDASLKGNRSAGVYLHPPVARGADGKWPRKPQDTPDDFAPASTAGVSHWPGFRRDRAHGLTLESVPVASPY
jgi:predicted dienelactone hydrolase